MRFGGRALTFANVVVQTVRLLGQTLDDTLWPGTVAVNPLVHVVELEGCKLSDFTQRPG